MKLNEIKKLSRKEFADRYPFVHTRFWNRDKMEYELGYYDEDIGYDIKKGDEVLEFYGNWHGWNDLLLCWAEKVREVFITMPKSSQDNLYIVEMKEKYGSLRMSLTGIIQSPYDKINEYIYMLEHMSRFTCLYCGKITKSSNGKKIFSWSNGYYSPCICKKCAKKEYFKEKHKIPFKSCYRKNEGTWFTYLVKYSNKPTNYKYNCKELFEGMY